MRAAVWWLAMLVRILPAQADVWREVRLASGEWSPYLGAGLPGQGQVGALVRDALATQKIDVRYAFLPWKRALEAARAGRIEGTLVWTLTPDRERDFLVSDPVMRSNVVLFCRRDRPVSWRTLEDLGRYRIGATLGYGYGDAWRAAVDRGVLRPELADTDEQNMDKLLAGRIDGFPLEKAVGLAMLQRRFGASGAGRVSTSAQPVHTAPLHLLVSPVLPGARDLLARFNAGLATLRARGTLAETGVSTLPR